MHWRTLAGSSLLFTLAAGCGYTEQEWGAQLSKYERLEAQSRDKDARIAEITRDLDATKARTAKLEADLTGLGVDLQHSTAQVGKLSATLEERERALAELREREQRLAQIKARFDVLKSKLEGLTTVGLAVVVRKNRMLVSLPGDVLFDSGRETLRKEGKDILAKIAGVIRSDPSLSSRDYQVTGHTDGKPVRGGIYKDNWGLSVMRAREVLVYLVNDKNGALPVEHWSAAGYGDADPVAPNDTAENLQKNRRCEIAILPSVDELLDLQAIAR